MATIYNIQIRTTSPFIAYSAVELTEMIGNWFNEYRNPTNGLGFENTNIIVTDITRDNKRKIAWTHISKPFDFIIDDECRIVLNLRNATITDKKILKKILDNIIRIHNETSDIELGSNGSIDQYLLDSPDCDQDTREEITEAIYNYYTND